MSNVKTAISIQQSLFEQVDSLAQEMEISRSRLFVLAMEDFMQRRQNQRLLKAINHAYADLPEPSEENLRRQLRQQHRRMVEGEW
ncbi:MAG: CopG family transcriptional regulator [Chloroflexi bacterium]|nr:MAG: CopG family transcriptional regulator [Chloroflexota bacterium]